jgi:hypothetical protein
MIPDPVAAELQFEMETLRTEVEKCDNEKKEILARIDAIQKALDLAPALEQELSELLRDQNALKIQYEGRIDYQTRGAGAGHCSMPPRISPFGSRQIDVDLIVSLFPGISGFPPESKRHRHTLNLRNGNIHELDPERSRRRIRVVDIFPAVG